MHQVIAVAAFQSLVVEVAFQSLLAVELNFAAVVLSLDIVALGFAAVVLQIVFVAK